MDYQEILTRCLDLSQHLETPGTPREYSFSRKVGDFSFSLDTRKHGTSTLWQKGKRVGKSPSTQRRNHRRRMEFLRNKGITPPGKTQIEASNGPPENELDSPRHTGDLQEASTEPGPGPEHEDIQCQQCDYLGNCNSGLQIHLREGCKKKNLPKSEPGPT